MQVISLNNNTRRIGNFQIKTNRTPNFTGLTDIASKQIYKKPMTIACASDYYPNANGAVGRLPKDILELLKPQDDNVDLKTNIIFFQNELNKVSELLAEVEKMKLQKIQKLDETGESKQFVNKFLVKLAKIKVPSQKSRIPRILQMMIFDLTPKKDEIARITDKVQEQMTQDFQVQGILKENERIKFQYLGQGRFKNAFKMEIVNDKDEKIIHPKTLLVFKENKTTNAQIDGVLNVLQNYYRTTNFALYFRTVNSLVDNASIKVVPEDKKELYKQILLEAYDNPDKFIEELRKMYHLSSKAQYSANGINAECNITQFVKENGGKPMLETDTVPVYYLNLSHNVGLSEFSDLDLPEIKTNIDLTKFGLFHSDIEYNKNNVVNGRTIDLGGIVCVKGLEELSQNKIARKICHKISQIKRKNPEDEAKARVEYWNKMYMLAFKNKIPQSREVLHGLEISKKLIKEKYWHKLADTILKSEFLETTSIDY